jgi:hypothetical protein
MTLLELCYNKPELILLESTESLIECQLKHYKEISPQNLTMRFQNLFDAVVKCIETNRNDDMIKYMEKVAAARFDSGYELNEVQIAINTLEEVFWRKISEFVDGDKQINAMKEISRITCNAKQRLLNEYALLSKEYVFA